MQNSFMWWNKVEERDGGGERLIEAYCNNTRQDKGALARINDW